MSFHPLTDSEHAALYAEMQRPAVPGSADELPEERRQSWLARFLAFLKVAA